MMKNFLMKSLAILVVTGAVYSCKPDEEDEPPTPVDPKSKFIGTWSCAEHSYTDNTNATYNIHIVDSSGSYMLMESFYNTGFNKKTRLVLLGDNDFKIDVPQSVAGFQILSGTGHLDNSSTISMKYEVHDGSAKDSLSAVLTKQ